MLTMVTFLCSPLPPGPGQRSLRTLLHNQSMSLANAATCQYTALLQWIATEENIKFNISALLSGPLGCKTRIVLLMRRVKLRLKYKSNCYSLQCILTLCIRQCWLFCIRCSVVFSRCLNLEKRDSLLKPRERRETPAACIIQLSLSLRSSFRWIWSYGWIWSYPWIWSYRWI